MVEASPRLAVIATCNLNQWALDFNGNKKRILESIAIAKSKGATYRTGPELEIPGYSCEDHFDEIDTVWHSWDVLAEILESGATDGLMCDFGMPVIYNSVQFNCRVICLDKKIVLIRPKIYLANYGNYREERWFTAWSKGKVLEEMSLPPRIQRVAGQKTASIGYGIVKTADTEIGYEVCEELWVLNATSQDQCLDGAKLIFNSSGSHHELRKLDTRMRLMKETSSKYGCIYIYSNHQGCDGSRLYFDGSSTIIKMGKVLAAGTQFSLKDVEVIIANINLNDIDGYRSISRATLKVAAQSQLFPRAVVDNYNITKDIFPMRESLPVPMTHHTPYEEISLGPACWLWDYLRRSGAAGYLLPLSGGVDSASVATIVGSMTKLVIKSIEEKDEQVIADVKKITKSDTLPKTPQELAGKLFYTVYMGTVNSSEETKKRASELAAQVGSNHREVTIDRITDGIRDTYKDLTGLSPKFMAHGGTDYREDLALQNIQARSRMTFAYMLAQLSSPQGFLLVLGAGNLDEGLRGYLTKYDCSSADINPIGGICKKDLQGFLAWSVEHLGYTALKNIYEATPTAELRPLAEGTSKVVQSDEDEMGMTYEELGQYGKLRKLQKCGPVSMYQKLVDTWTHLSPTTVADKVKHFFRTYSINRHKMTTLTPSYHCEGYGNDDNRYDHRQFLFNVTWERQFSEIDKLCSTYNPKV